MQKRVIALFLHEMHTENAENLCRKSFMFFPPFFNQRCENEVAFKGGVACLLFSFTNQSAYEV